MDADRFDALSRRLDHSPSRRTLLGGFTGALAALLGGSATDGSSQRKRGRFSAQGPCGNGGPRANRCRRHRDCCTRLCDRRAGRRHGRCRCRQEGERCTQDRNCCRVGGQDLGCRDGRCRSSQPLTCEPPCEEPQRFCDPGTGTCCSGVGSPCTGSADCCVTVPNVDVCPEGFCTACQGHGRSCTFDGACCSARCESGECACEPLGATCTTLLDCCVTPGRETLCNSVCCLGPGSECAPDDVCCAGACTGGTCPVA